MPRSHAAVPYCINRHDADGFKRSSLPIVRLAAVCLFSAATAYLVELVGPSGLLGRWLTLARVHPNENQPAGLAPKP